MKPYYEHGGIAIYHGDCREILPTLPKVDLILTDPPYGISLSSHDKTGETGRRPNMQVTGDNDQNLCNWLYSFTLESNTALIAFASPMKPIAGEWRQFLVWSKGGGSGGGDTATLWKPSWELIQVRGTGKLNGARDEAVLRYEIRPGCNPFHPTQKPLPLIKYLLFKTTSDSSLVADPFMGSGTTLVAAKSLGLSAIGIEREEKYCEIAAKRLSQEVFTFDEGAA